MTKLPDRGPCRSMEPGGTACWQGCYQKVTICEKQTRVDRKTNLTLAIFIFVGVDKPLANWPRVVEVESVTAFLCLFVLLGASTTGLTLVNPVFFCLRKTKAQMRYPIWK